MKNFAAVFDGYKMSISTLRYAIELSRRNNAMLTGVFLEPFYYHNYSTAEILAQDCDHKMAIRKLQEKDRELRLKAVKDFQEACAAAEIAFNVHRNFGVPLQDLQTESMFADLVIISEHETFTRNSEVTGLEFIMELLSSVYCPVMIVPAAFKVPHRLTYLYDGSPSSILAIKTLGSLFEESVQTAVTLLSVSRRRNEENYLPEEKQILTLLKRLFSSSSYKVLYGDVKDIMRSHIGYDPGNVIVMGTHHLNFLKDLVVRNLIYELLKELDIPAIVAPARCA